MKYLYFLLTFFLVGTFASYSQEKANTCQLTIHFDTPENATGKIYFLVFNSPEDFGDEKKAYNCAIVCPPMVTICEYAVTAFQDTDNTGKIMTNFLGIPKEPVGTSDNPKMMGAPKWKDAAFSVNQPKQELTIDLKKIF